MGAVVVVDYYPNNCSFIIVKITCLHFSSAMVDMHFDENMEHVMFSEGRVNESL